MPDRIANKPRLDFYSQEYKMPEEDPVFPFWEDVLTYIDWPYYKPTTIFQDPYNLDRKQFLEKYYLETSLSLFDYCDFHPSHFNKRGGACLYATHFEQIGGTTTTEYLLNEFDFNNVKSNTQFINNLMVLMCDDSLNDADVILRKQYREACRNILIYATFKYEGMAVDVINESSKVDYSKAKIIFDYINEDNHHFCYIKPYIRQVFIEGQLNESVFIERDPDYINVYFFAEIEIYKKENGTDVLIKSNTLKNQLYSRNETSRLYYLEDYTYCIEALNIKVLIQYIGINEIEISVTCLPTLFWTDKNSYFFPSFSRGNIYDTYDTIESEVDLICRTQGSPMCINAFNEFESYFVLSLICRSIPHFGTNVGFGKSDDNHKLYINTFAIGRLYYTEDDDGNYVYPDQFANYCRPHYEYNWSYDVIRPYLDVSPENDINCNSPAYSSDFRRFTGKPSPVIFIRTYYEYLLMDSISSINTNLFELKRTDYNIFAQMDTSSNSQMGYTGSKRGSWPLIPFTDCEEMKVTFNNVKNFADGEWGYNQNYPLDSFWWWHPSFQIAPTMMYPGSQLNICQDCNSIFNNTEFILQKVTEADISAEFDDGFQRTQPVRTYWELDLTLLNICQDAVWHTIFKTEDDGNIEHDIGTLKYRFIKMILYPYFANVSGSYYPSWKLEIFIEIDWHDMPDYSEWGVGDGYLGISRIFYSAFTGYPFVRDDYTYLPPEVQWNNDYKIFRATISLNLPFDEKYQHHHYPKDTQSSILDLGMLGNKTYSTDQPNFLYIHPDNTTHLSANYTLRYPAFYAFGNAMVGFFRIGAGYGIPHPPTCTVCNFENCDVTIEPADDKYKLENINTVNWDELLNDELEDNELTNPTGAQSERIDRPVY